MHGACGAWGQAMVGGVVVEPVDPDCAAGVIFFNNTGYLNMCGHGTMGLVTTLSDLFMYLGTECTAQEICAFYRMCRPVALKREEKAAERKRAPGSASASQGVIGSPLQATAILREDRRSSNSDALVEERILVTGFAARSRRCHGQAGAGQRGREVHAPGVASGLAPAVAGPDLPPGMAIWAF